MTTEDQCRREFEAALSRAQKFTIGEGGDAWLGWQMCWNRHESDRRDAARYRWLRTGNTMPCVLMQAVLTQGELDAAIDAAIEKEQGGQ